jgi:hypothetical protein
LVFASAVIARAKKGKAGMDALAVVSARDLAGVTKRRSLCHVRSQEEQIISLIQAAAPTPLA